MSAYLPGNSRLPVRLWFDTLALRRPRPGARRGRARTSSALPRPCGAVGINIEDSIPGQPGALRDTTEQSARISAARSAAEQSGIPIFINARCDVYFGAQIAAAASVGEVLARVKCYHDAGADGLFLPGLLDPVTISITTQVGLPVNIMIGTACTPSFAELVDAGARRLSKVAQHLSLLSAR